MSISADIIKENASRYPTAFIYVKDEKFRYIEGNDNILSFFGFTDVKQLSGKNDYDLFKACFAKQYVQHDQTAVTKGELHTIESLLTREGDIILMSVKKYHFINEETKQSGIVGISRHINAKLIESFVSILEYNNVDEFKKSDSPFSIKINKNALKLLTERELEVLYYILCGLTQNQIAGTLHLSSRTVEDYVNRVKVKLKCRTKSQLFEFAFRHGILNIASKHEQLIFD